MLIDQPESHIKAVSWLERLEHDIFCKCCSWVDQEKDFQSYFQARKCWIWCWLSLFWVVSWLLLAEMMLTPESSAIKELPGVAYMIVFRIITIFLMRSKSTVEAGNLIFVVCSVISTCLGLFDGIWVFQARVSFTTPIVCYLVDFGPLSSSIIIIAFLSIAYIMPMGKRAVLDFQDPTIFRRVQFYAYLNLSLSLIIAAASYWTSNILLDRTRQQANNRTIFLARLSHEIRTPLVSIIGAWEVIRDRFNKLKDENERSAAATIDISCENLRQLVNDILDATKFGVVQEVAVSTSTSVTELIQTSLALLDRRARSRNVHLEWKVDKEVPEVVFVDSFKLGQVLTNLIVNAIKFSEPGKGFVNVQVGFTPAPAVPAQSVASVLKRLLLPKVTSVPIKEEKWLRFQIADNGMGISPEIMPSLFHLFYQGRADTARKYGGSGLGLSICKHLVDMMSGRIQLQSAGEGFGTTALVDVPILVTHEKSRSHSDPSCDRPTSNEKQDGVEIYRRFSTTLGQEQRESTPIVVARLRTSGPPPPNHDDEEEAGVLPHESPEEPSKLYGHCTAILAEDNAFSRTVIKAMLSKLGFKKIVEVSDGDDLVATVHAYADEFNSGGCVIVLTDLEMPEMSGFDAMKQIRRFAASVPIIVLSAHPFSEYRQKAKECGADAFLSKPLKMGELEAVLKTVHSPTHRSERQERQ